MNSNFKIEMTFSQILAITSWSTELPIVSRLKTKPYKCQKKTKKLALKLGKKTYQLLTNGDEVCIPSFSSILLAVL